MVTVDQEQELLKPNSIYISESLCYGMNHQKQLWLMILTAHPSFFLVFFWGGEGGEEGSWIEKQSGRVHLASFGTKIVMSGPIVRQLCVEEAEKERNKDLEDFMFFSLHTSHCSFGVAGLLP